MAQRFGANVTLLNAFDLVPDYFLTHLGEDHVEPKAIPYAPALQELRKQREHRLQEFSRTEFPGLAQTVRIEVGDPVTVIEWVAQRENTDLIMMPTKAAEDFARLLLGSATAKVSHDLSCRVFTSAHDPDHALAPGRLPFDPLCGGPESRGRCGP